MSDVRQGQVYRSGDLTYVVTQVRYATTRAVLERLVDGKLRDVSFKRLRSKAYTLLGRS